MSSETALEHAPPDFLPWVADLVRAHRTELLRYAQGRSCGADDALDAVQDAFVTFLALPQAREVARAGNEAVKLLVTLLRNHLANRRRKAARRAARSAPLEQAEAEHVAESSAELIARAEEIARVRGCILRMARLQRAVIELALLDGEPHEVIAERLGITPGYARVLLHRAREHVRHCAYDELSAEDPEPDPSREL